MKIMTWTKMLAAGGALCIGGPALVYYVMPTEEQLISRYNPELRKRALDAKLRYEREEDFDKFVTRLKQYSKSDKHIWTVWEEDVERKRLAAIEAERAAKADAKARRDEIKDSIK